MELMLRLALRYPWQVSTPKICTDHSGRLLRHLFSILIPTAFLCAASPRGDVPHSCVFISFVFCNQTTFGSVDLLASLANLLQPGSLRLLCVLAFVCVLRIIYYHCHSDHQLNVAEYLLVKFQAGQLLQKIHLKCSQPCETKTRSTLRTSTYALITLDPFQPSVLSLHSSPFRSFQISARSALSFHLNVFPRQFLLCVQPAPLICDALFFELFMVHNSLGILYFSPCRSATYHSSSPAALKLATRGAK